MVHRIKTRGKNERGYKEKGSTAMKKEWKKVVGRTVGILCISGVITAGLVYAKDTNLKDRIWLNQHVSIENAKSGVDDVKAINNAKAVSFWNLDYQNTVTNKIKNMLKDGNYTVENPLLIVNPYGTNTCSVNVYFEAEEGAKLNYRVSTKEYGVFEETAYTKEGSTLYEAQLVGFMPGEENTVTLTLSKGDTVLGQSEHSITMPEAASKVTKKVDYTDGESTQPLSNGLYVAFGHSKSFDANIYMYDNNGVLRGELPVREYRSDRLLFIDDCIFYSYGFNKIAKVNRMGQIVDTYKFSSDYELHHDFIYDEKNDRILMLASSTIGETVEDLILSLDLKTGKTIELVDMKDLMPEAYENAVQPDAKEKLDWIHINSLQLTNAGDLLLSSRETSTIVCVTDIDSEPKLSYLLCDPSMWEGTDYEEYMFTKVGDFTAQAGQHSITVMHEESESLPEGQYYLYMFNNNFTYSGTRPQIKWDNYKGAGNYKAQADYSKYYRYLVDTKGKTFTLVKEFDVPYSPYVSSAENYGDNFVIASGSVSNYGEYDQEGTLIRHFEFNDEKYVYRVYKYEFENFYFEQ